jgi:bacterioferritin
MKTDTKPHDLKSIRKQAALNLADGAVTAGYTADRKRVLRMLDTALATELVCMLRYRRHYYTAHSLRAQAVADEFKEHARQEEEHLGKIAERISQLGGEPDLNPETATERSHAQYDDSTDLIDMIKADLIAERIAIDIYRDMIRELGNDDPTTRRMIEHILAQEEEHAHEFAGLLENVSSNGQVQPPSRIADVLPSEAPRGGAAGRAMHEPPKESRSNLARVVEVANELVPDEISESNGASHDEYIPKE